MEIGTRFLMWAFLAVTQAVLSTPAMRELPPHKKSTRVSTTTATASTETVTANLLRDVMRENVQVPLAALRASLESLSAQARQGGFHPQTLENSAHQFTEVSRRVQTLLDFCQPPTLHPEHCRNSAVLQCATAPLSSQARRALAVSAESTSSLNVDIARLGHCLAQWIELTVDEGATQVLLLSRGEGTSSTFSLLSDETHGSCQVHELQRRLLEKEVVRMGGSIETTELSCGGQITLRFESEAGEPQLSGARRERISESVHGPKDEAA